ncbi:HhH-GPD family protein [Protaetiibacter intestinalis]|uniref:Adenine DNA glycosylase n=1 Tax=Protaetiibacter intestinalis TaxID=2419774 RepID=A0A387BAD5_9MICO|nr:A/G-specific adenine glycosylase [Protaetiibacter intestinalis]AYF98861.1 A/G-specific adenine glycosylase [Protaetiibacter intestinalis]
MASAYAEQVQRAADAGIGESVAAWFAAGHRPLPWRATGFPAWGVLVSEFMLQQTPVARVIPRLAEWLERWPEPAALAAVPPGEAVRAWDRLGYPRRALNLHAASVAITERHAGVVPEDIEALLALPGVGPYTARAVAAFAYGIRVPVVDVNVRRVLARAVRGVGEPGPARTTEELALMESLLPADAPTARLANAGMMELGQTVCTARTPDCARCPIAAACAWRAAGYPAYTGPAAPRQKPYAGSDREVRGRILRELRASELPVPASRVAELWADAVQRERALAGLLADGLAVAVDDAYALPTA